LRAGTGIFFAQDIGNSVFDMGRNFVGRFTVTQSTHELTWKNPILAVGNNPCGVSAPLVCINQPLALVHNYDRKTPYITQYELNIQRQLTGSTALEAGSATWPISPFSGQRRSRSAGPFRSLA
jgi:hypothetical protein